MRTPELSRYRPDDLRKIVIISSEKDNFSNIRFNYKVLSHHLRNPYGDPYKIMWSTDFSKPILFRNRRQAMTFFKNIPIHIKPKEVVYSFLECAYTEGIEEARLKKGYVLKRKGFKYQLVKITDSQKVVIKRKTSNKHSKLSSILIDENMQLTEEGKKMLSVTKDFIIKETTSGRYVTLPAKGSFLTKYKEKATKLGEGEANYFKNQLKDRSFFECFNGLNFVVERF